MRTRNLQRLRLHAPVAALLPAYVGKVDSDKARRALRTIYANNVRRFASEHAGPKIYARIASRLPGILRTTQEFFDRRRDNDSSGGFGRRTHGRDGASLLSSAPGSEAPHSAASLSQGQRAAGGAWTSRSRFASLSQGSEPNVASSIVAEKEGDAESIGTCTTHENETRPLHGINRSHSAIAAAAAAARAGERLPLVASDLVLPRASRSTSATASMVPSAVESGVMTTGVESPLLSRGLARNDRRSQASDFGGAGRSVDNAGRDRDGETTASAARAGLDEGDVEVESEFDVPTEKEALKVRDYDLHAYLVYALLLVGLWVPSRVCPVVTS